MVERGQRVWLAGVDWLRQTFGIGASDVTPAPRLASTESTEAESLDTDAAETDELDEALDEAEVLTPTLTLKTTLSKTTLMSKMTFQIPIWRWIMLTPRRP